LIEKISVFVRTFCCSLITLPSFTGVCSCPSSRTSEKLVEFRILHRADSEIYQHQFQEHVQNHSRMVRIDFLNNSYLHTSIHTYIHTYIRTYKVAMNFIFVCTFLVFHVVIRCMYVCGTLRSKKDKVVVNDYSHVCIHVCMNICIT
jgi:hypothetical protein